MNPSVHRECSTCVSGFVAMRIFECTSRDASMCVCTYVDHSHTKWRQVILCHVHGVLVESQQVSFLSFHFIFELIEIISGFPNAKPTGYTVSEIGRKQPSQPNLTKPNTPSECGKYKLFQEKNTSTKNLSIVAIAAKILKETNKKKSTATKQMNMSGEQVL